MSSDYRYTTQSVETPIPFTRNISKISYKVIDLIFNVRADFQVDFYDEHDRLCFNSMYSMRDEEYKGWNDDDDYVYNMIIKNLDDILYKPFFSA